MEDLFEFLKLKNLTPKNCRKTLSNLKDIEIEEIIEYAMGIILTSDNNVESSKFNFVANSTLSGGMFPCYEETCRMNNIDTLARNSILYADTVFIENPFEKYMHVSLYNEHARYLLFVDILLLYYVKPLLDEHIFRFTDSFHHFCRDCLKEVKAITKTYLEKIKKAESILLSSIFKECSFNLVIDEEGTPYVSIDGSFDFFSHPLAIHFFKEKAELFKKLKGKELHKLSNKEVIDLGLAERFVNPIIDDLLTQNYYSKLTNSSYLTNRDIDSKLIHENQSKKGSSININLTQSLGHQIPFLPKVDFKKLINLRKKEGEAFQIYRTSLTNFLSSIKDSNYNLKEAFADEIQPEINKMNQAIKTSKRIILSDITKDILVGSTFVSVGLFSNFLPPNIGQLVAGVGGVGYLGKFGDNIKKLITIDTEIQNNKYFFVWKVLKG